MKQKLMLQKLVKTLIILGKKSWILYSQMCRSKVLYNIMEIKVTIKDLYHKAITKQTTRLTDDLKNYYFSPVPDGLVSLQHLIRFS